MSAARLESEAARSRKLGTKYGRHILDPSTLSVKGLRVEFRPGRAIFEGIYVFSDNGRNPDATTRKCGVYVPPGVALWASVWMHVKGLWVPMCTKAAQAVPGCSTGWQVRGVSLVENVQMNGTYSRCCRAFSSRDCNPIKPDTVAALSASVPEPL